MKKFISIVAAAALSFSLAGATVYSVDAVHSSVGFKIKHLSVSNVTGVFGKFAGTADIENKIPKAIDATIEVSSVNTGNQGRDAHLQKEDFFDAKKFPQMKFVMKEFKDGKVIGDLTIRDVTKPVTLDYEFGGEGKNRDGKAIAGFTLTGKISRKDFNFAPGSGEMTLGDEVKLNIEVESVAK